MVTSYMRLRLGRHLWKSFHFSIYFAAAAVFWHSLSTDPSLKNAPVDWFDGGKLLVESCLLLIVAIGLLRLRYARRKALRARRSAQPAAASD
jgi:DMSO/TMAO reductase YedYZ heme-binding membrane subunit